MNRFVLFVGVLLAVTGFGLTRWVAFEIDNTYDARDTGLRDMAWNDGPEIIQEPEHIIHAPNLDVALTRPDLFPLPKQHGVPRKNLYLAGWIVCAVGAALTAISMKRRVPA